MSGVDYATIRADGNLDLDIRGVIGKGRQTVSYRASGVSIMKSKTEAMPQELLTFQTSDDDLSWLNTAVGGGSRPRSRSRPDPHCLHSEGLIPPRAGPDSDPARGFLHH